ncbi:transcriptional regulator with HTH domain and aminotransferase domain [Burkholderia sp. Ch1-1]|uniref:Transcriptional regulator with HTH domain and aminotransferase domain n=1 Tax=Paraburkholderia dioscoreae TaxID=2604047 RepID=A0A5Q4ZC81_9BURK|nr:MULTISPECIES: PLP-dependent aminotransferase family protein [Paraburkholderia]EIF31670.1 transcriptional regulator with HTH domain and aminotransferase domain [Burkholderia sp. Ch1-1]MDR8398010.1 PLP-dependent aminotransferase family protein [Paraburkholderia sp. USG1]VVD28047.1 Transcriptional regulator with HTH domain and aminotransferase domain [Paraburkholderia dioscoreae]
MTVKPIIDMVSILKPSLECGRTPKYKRLAEALATRIHDGSIAGGAKLPPHRLLADKLGVTAGTVSRAYAELERIGLVVARVGDGTFVRKRGLERSCDRGFKNCSDEPHRCIDMSRSMHIPGQEAVMLARSLDELAADGETLRELMLYTPDLGSARHRQAGAQWLGHGDFASGPDQIVCVNGGQHGLLCALIALLRAGDIVVTERLTYPGLISAARLLGIKLLGIEMDEEGLMPQALLDVCRTHRVSALYCTPSIQNPTTAVLSVERREIVAKVCRAHNVLIIEDEAHGVLMANRPPPISLFAPERGVVIGSLSKVVAAGLRVGYVHAPLPLISRFGAAVRATCWMATPLPLELASRWIEEGVAQRLMRQQAAELERRKHLVERHLSGLNYVTHPQSPHFWIEVPAPGRAVDVQTVLGQQNCLVSAAGLFAVGQSVVPEFVRASVSHAGGGDELLQSGFAALSATLRQHAHAKLPHAKPE